MHSTNLTVTTRWPAGQQVQVTKDTANVELLRLATDGFSRLERLAYTPVSLRLRAVGDGNRPELASWEEGKFLLGWLPGHNPRSRCPIYIARHYYLEEPAGQAWLAAQQARFKQPGICGLVGDEVISWVAQDRAPNPEHTAAAAWLLSQVASNQPRFSVSAGRRAFNDLQSVGLRLPGDDCIMLGPLPVRKDTFRGYDRTTAEQDQVRLYDNITNTRDLFFDRRLTPSELDMYQQMRQSGLEPHDARKAAQLLNS